MTAGRRPGPAGFTLIEILVVVVIMGLALSITAGFIARPNTGLELANASARVSGALRLARSRAMTEARTVAFAVTPDGHGFAVDRTVTMLPPSVALAMTDARAILFSPDGSSSGGTLAVASGSLRRFVRVEWLTGRVTQSGEP